MVRFTNDGTVLDPETDDDFGPIETTIRRRSNNKQQLWDGVIYNKPRLRTEMISSLEVKNVVKRNNSITLDSTEDQGYGISSLWDAKHFDKLNDIFYDIRKGNKERFQDIVNLCIDLPKGKDFAPKLTHSGKNIITHPGIALTNKNITGEDTTRFLYIFSGTSNAQTPTIFSTGIDEENARMSILDTGFMFASGTAIFQGCVFPTTIPDAQVKAFGSSTHADIADPHHVTFWISRILDPTKYVNHEQGKTVYSHLHVIERRSRLSE
jgi:hypothetical protein